MYPISFRFKKHLPVRFAQLIFFLTLFNIVSCDCGNGSKKIKTDKGIPFQDEATLNTGRREEEGKISMSIKQPTLLIGDQKTTEVVFSLVDKNKPAALENFTLQASYKYTEGRGRVGYTVYEDGKKTTKTDDSVREKLVKFSASKKLELDNEPLKIEIFLEPTEGSGRVTLELKLLDKWGIPISTEEVKWRKEADAVNLKLVSKGSTSIKGKEPILLQIINKVDEVVDIGKAKLQVKRVKGAHARIGEATYLNDDTQEIDDLGKIYPRQEIDKTLSVEPNGDTKATFSFQLLYEGEEMGEAIEIDWEKEEPVRLKDVNYDPITRHITCKVENTTYQSLNEVKIVYKSEKSGIKLGGKDLLYSEENTVDVGYISYVGATKDLGELDFGSNRMVEFKFKLQYEGGETSFVSYTFTAADIKVGLKVDYDLAQGQVSYTLTNTGKEAATNVKLIYKNMSAKEGETAVLLDGKKEGETTSITLAARRGESKGTLPIRFNTQEKATFEFMVAAEGIILTHLTQEKDFKAPKVDLELVPINGNNITKSFDLKGNNKEAKFKIVRQKGSGEVDLKNLKVVIKQEEGNKGFLSTKPNGVSEVKELTGDQLGNIDDEIKLYVIPNEEKKLRFEITLFYKKQQMDRFPLTIKWEKGEANLKLSFVDPSVSASTTFIKLEELPKSIKVKIEPQPGSSSIDDNQLKLVVTEITVGRSFLTKAGSNTKITQLVGAELGNLGEELTLDIHPEGDEKLEFKLELFYKDQPISNPRFVSWKAKEVKLRLRLIDPIPDPANSSFVGLEESVKAIKLKIEPEVGSGTVDMKQLRLDMSRTLGHTGFLSKSKGGTQVDKLIGDQLGKIGDEITLYVNPQGDEELEFKLQLYYKEKLNYIPLRLNRNKDKIEIINLTPFAGDEAATFRLKNNSDHSISWEGLGQIQIEVISNNKSEFTLLDKDGMPVDKIATLKDVYNAANESVRFKLLADYGENNAIVTIKLTKKGASSPIDSQQTVWRKEKCKLGAFLSDIDEGGYLTKGSTVITLGNEVDNTDIDIRDIKLTLVNAKGLTIQFNGKVYQGNVSSTLQDITGQDKIGPNDMIDVPLQVVSHPQDVTSAELLLELQDENDEIFYKTKLIWIDDSAVKGWYQALVRRAAAIKYQDLDRAIENFSKAKDNSFLSEFIKLDRIVVIQKKSQQIRQEAESLSNTLQDPLLTERYKLGIRKNILVPTEDVIEKANEFLKDYMQSAEDKVKKLLEKDQLGEANKVFAKAKEIYTDVLNTEESKQRVIAISNAIVQKLDGQAQEYAANINKDSSKGAMEVATMAVEMSKDKDGFTQAGQLEEIAKEAYKAALDILFSLLCENVASTVPTTSDADRMLREAVKLAEVAKNYELELTKVEKVNRAAYMAAVQAQLEMADYYKNEISNAVNPSIYGKEAEAAFTVAKNTATVGKEAQLSGFGSEDINQVVKAAYIAVAKARLAMADYYKNEISNAVNPSIYGKEAEAAFTVAKNTATVGKEAQLSGFGSEDINQVVKAAYISASRTWLAMADYYKNKISNAVNPSIYGKEAEAAFTVAKNTATVGKEAQLSGFGSEDINQVVKAAYIAVVQARLAMTDYYKNKISNAANPSIYVKEAKEAFTVAKNAAIVAKEAQSSGFGSEDINQVVKEAYTSASRTWLAMADYYKNKISNAVNPSIYVKEAGEAFTVAKNAAIVAKEAQSSGFGSEDINQVVKEAYEAALAVYETLNSKQKKYNDIIKQIKDKIEQLSKST